MLKVAALTGGKNASPARFRVRQYISYLKAHGIFINEFAAPFSSWPPGQKWVRPLWAVATLFSRVPAIAASYRYDVTLIQQSLVSTYKTIEVLTARPRVLDVDDAIWAFSKRKTFAWKLAGICDSVICGNNFLAEHFGKWNSNIVVIPTGVDTSYFHPVKRQKPDKCVIGWSGGSGGFKYLYQIENALKKVLENNPGTVFSITADRRPDFKILPSNQVVYTPWSPDIEVKAIQNVDIGIMPIADDIVSRGKCSYKMLLYMACGKPVVVSPYGMNNEVLAKGDVGYMAVTEKEWVDALTDLIRSPELCRLRGREGRNVAVSHYSLEKTGNILAAHLLSIL